ncbi:unnamed protein product [Amoebophrya sp. A25]|nr:unnamed protein product [Amoebophrya sp. A25]|eukprot:GSA25T00010418001.1
MFDATPQLDRFESQFLSQENAGWGSNTTPRQGAPPVVVYPLLAEADVGGVGAEELGTGTTTQAQLAEHFHVRGNGDATDLASPEALSSLSPSPRTIRERHRNFFDCTENNSNCSSPPHQEQEYYVSGATPTGGVSMHQVTSSPEDDGFYSATQSKSAGGGSRSVSLGISSKDLSSSSGNEGGGFGVPRRAAGDATCKIGESCTTHDKRSYRGTSIAQPGYSDLAAYLEEAVEGCDGDEASFKSPLDHQSKRVGNLGARIASEGDQVPGQIHAMQPGSTTSCPTSSRSVGGQHHDIKQRNVVKGSTVISSTITTTSDSAPINSAPEDIEAQAAAMRYRSRFLAYQRHPDDILETHLAQQLVCASCCCFPLFLVVPNAWKPTEKLPVIPLAEQEQAKAVTQGNAAKASYISGVSSWLREQDSPSKRVLMGWAATICGVSWNSAKTLCKILEETSGISVYGLWFGVVGFFHVLFVTIASQALPLIFGPLQSFLPMYYIVFSFLTYFFWLKCMLDAYFPGLDCQRLCDHWRLRVQLAVARRKRKVVLGASTTTLSGAGGGNAKNHGRDDVQYDPRNKNEAGALVGRPIRAAGSSLCVHPSRSDSAPEELEDELALTEMSRVDYQGRRRPTSFVDLCLNIHGTARIFIGTIIFFTLASAIFGASFVNPGYVPLRTYPWNVDPFTDTSYRYGADREDVSGQYHLYFGDADSRLKYEAIIRDYWQKGLSDSERLYMSGVENPESAKLVSSTVEFCPTCKAWKVHIDKHIHHCRICQRCTVGCPFIGNCVGAVNYKAFCLFILFSCIWAVFGTYTLACETASFTIVSNPLDDLQYQAELAASNRARLEQVFDYHRKSLLVLHQEQEDIATTRTLQVHSNAGGVDQEAAPASSRAGGFGSARSGKVGPASGLPTQSQANVRTKTGNVLASSAGAGGENTFPIDHHTHQLQGRQVHQDQGPDKGYGSCGIAGTDDAVASDLVIPRPVPLYITPKRFNWFRDVLLAAAYRPHRRREYKSTLSKSTSGEVEEGVGRAGMLGNVDPAISPPPFNRMHECTRVRTAFRTRNGVYLLCLVTSVLWWGFMILFPGIMITVQTGHLHHNSWPLAMFGLDEGSAEMATVFGDNQKVLKLVSTSSSTSSTPVSSSTASGLVKQIVEETTPWWCRFSLSESCQPYGRRSVHDWSWYQAGRSERDYMDSLLNLNPTPTPARANGM